MKKYWSPSEPTVLRYPMPNSGEWYEVDESFVPAAGIVVDGQAAQDPAVLSQIAADKAAKEASMATTLAAIDTAKTAAQKARAALVAAKGATDLATTQAALIKTARVLHNLVKALNITDPTEAE